MKKFYSLVLMAAMLLVGTNAWATNVAKVVIGENENFYESVETAFAAVQAEETATITLLQDANGWNSAIEIVNKTITLDMAGFNMPGGDAARIWIKLGGHVKIVGQGVLSTTTTANTMFIRLEGSPDPAAVNATTLEVGPDVTISGGAYGISVYGWNSHNENNKTGIKNDYGVYVKVEGTITTARPALYVEGNFKVTSGNGPIFDVESSALLQVPTDLIEYDQFDSGEKASVVKAGYSTYKSAVAAIYAAGYSTWNIKGTVIGGNGVYVKGGHVNVIGGTVIAAAEEYWAPLFHGNGYIAAASSIILDNNASYCDKISMTITGNAVVTSEAGCAIEELITSGTEQMGAEDFVIESGTFTSGNGKPAVTVTTQLGTEVQQEGTVSGGMFSTPVDEILSITGEYTEIEVDGVTYQVIHEEVDPVTTLATSTIADPVKMNGTTYTVGNGETARTKYLELENGANVIVNDGGSLVIGVEGVIVKDASYIIVKAGGKLIINAGIITSSVDQLIVEASETKSGLLVAAPGVTWNAQPLATVQFYTFGLQYSANSHKWQRIATPLSHYESISNDFAGTTQDGNPFTTWVQSWTGSEWAPVNSWSSLKPFSGYALTNNSINGGVTYSFKGNIQGGVSSNLEFISNGLNFFGNSYTAPIQVVPMLQKMVAAGADDAFHIWNAASQRYEAGSSFYAEMGLCPSEIPATQTFVLNLHTGSSVVADIDYANSVWAPYANMTSSNPAPAARRSMPANLTFVQINIASANGDADKVMLVEGEQFSENFDNGADIVKFVEDNRMNMYVEGEENYAAAASNNILGTTLAIKAADEINYTMTFSNVMGESYAIKDMQTGAIINMEEGNEYQFVAQANATTEGRFQIVERNNAPTAIDNTEVVKNIKGIYTITGQYVGENYDALPAGVYVVDGVKIVK